MAQGDQFKKYAELITQCDLLIKAGKISSVQTLLAHISYAQVPRSSRQSLAKICRRAGLISQGLKLLQPLIRTEKSQAAPATAEEICEYAVLLSRNGSNLEAMTLLEAVDGHQTPEAFLYLAYCHIINWDYTLAATLLETFLRSRADDYTKLIARVNLASAYLAIDRLQEASELLSATIAQAESQGASRLVGNCLELLGHVHFLAGAFSAARKILKQASEYFGQTQSYDQLLIFKTQSFIEALETNSVLPLRKFREDAFLRKHWESVREADLYITKVQFDQHLVDHLVFGSPMQAFQQRVLKEVNAQPSPKYIYGDGDGILFDLKTGNLKGIELNPGKKIHQTIAALIKDFYVPRNIGTLFSELYPNEYFDINSSRHRVNQLLSRTRAWLAENEIPASIEEQNGSHRLILHPGFGIQMSLENQSIDSTSLKWAELQKEFPPRSVFSASEACLTLGWTRSTFLRVAKWADSLGQLAKSGTGRATLYEVLDPMRSNGKKSAVKTNTVVSL